MKAKSTVMTSSRIIATGMTSLIKSNQSASLLKQRALEIAVNSVEGLQLDRIDGLISVPSLSESRFMDGHFLATKMNLLPSKNPRGDNKLIDT